MKIRQFLLAASVILFVYSTLLFTSPHYYVYHTATAIKIDGVMDEPDWQDIPWIPFLDITDGSFPPYQSRAKMLWNKKGLYVGFEFEDPDIWATLVPETKETEDENGQDISKVHVIMLNDPFLKIFLDPDADGKNYLEFHINVLNCVNDLRIDVQYNKGGRGYWDWSCKGLKSAIDVDGTVNNPSDVDKGWRGELFIPWSGLSEYTEGHCPPSPGNVWRVLMGRVFRSEPGGKRIYVTWPVIGEENCHLLDRYGYIRFERTSSVISKKKKMKDENPLKYKIVWEWSMNTSTDTEIVNIAKSLGFNALRSRGDSIIPVAHWAGLQVYGLLNFSNIPKEYRQVVDSEDISRSEQMKNSPVRNLYQGGGEPVVGGEMLNSNSPPCWSRPEVREYGKKKIDELIARGYDGIAFDGIGYMNYYGCFCPYCQKNLEEYIEKSGLQRQQATFRYFEDTLVSFYNELIRYAKKRKPGIKIICHIWPHFVPNPLYGNRLVLDYCGQTAAWFFHPHWGYDKIRRYTYEMVRKQGRYVSPFIGIFSFPEKDMKSPERVREEMYIVKESGASAIQIAELGAITRMPEIAEIIRRELIE